MSNLESRMVLHGFICDQFGYENLRAMLNRLDGLSQGFIVNAASRFFQVISADMDPYPKGVTQDDLARYDANIIAHSQTLGMVDDRGKSWKPFQYLALLFTERYLDLYFQDREVLIDALNKSKKGGSAHDMADYNADDIHTLAFQSATGSGKTLLLHANILQYKCYLKAYKQLHKLNKIILVTPDEGLSRQHLRELQASNIPAQLFSDNQGAGIFSSGGAMVDIIDLHKLDDKKGIKRVALESFEENNLVLVDEGHLGTSGTVFRRRRKQLAKNGFTFEYSATFNQAVSGSGEDIKKLRDEYGKSILFDYSYKFFYGDGYGKDYQISNLQNADDGEANNFYLLACLLTFYQQCRIYEDNGGQWRDFNMAPPLWVFLGKTVTGGVTAGKTATETDVVKIVNFLAWAQSNRQDVVQGITKLLSGNTGLIDANGADIFGKSFSYIAGRKPQEVYDDLLTTVFRAPGQLHISHLTGSDELQLSAADASPFGVINVGDTPKLYTKLEAVENPLFALSKNAFAQPLFEQVDHHTSPVNIVIGARKFAAGWNSWRVSTMGLMHVGAGEGPQIIQMFGRGVRLKGYGMSLKRHTALEGVKPDGSEQLKLLETLNIFGLKANYMDKFKAYLQNEGVKVDRVTFTIATKKQFGNVKDLKILQKQEKAGDFQYSEQRINLLDLSKQPDAQNVVELNLYRHLQVLESGDGKTDDGASVSQSRKLEKKHLDLINKRAVYHKVLERKRRCSWHNMEISQEMVNTLIENQDWYNLHIPPEKMELSHYGRVHEWENLAVDLVSEYANQRWRRKRNTWEHEHIEMVPLTNKNPNYVEKYELSVDEKEKDLMQNIENLVKRANQGDYSQDMDFNKVQLSLLTPDFHAYIPLLHASAGAEKSVQITPVPLNAGEAKFVKGLKSVAESRADCVLGKEIYLMRNLSRGKGISFFDDYSFYPDFILWVKSAKRQDILFIDPKGLVRYDSRVASKVNLHKRIKETQKKIQKKNPELFLHSYIWSETNPRDIGTDKQMPRDEYHEKGIFFDSDYEFIKLLEHALK